MTTATATVRYLPIRRRALPLCALGAPYRPLADVLAGLRGAAGGAAALAHRRAVAVGLSCRR